MIRTILISNFQLHKELRIDLEPGVNTIVGESDAGKTAIFRALRWLALNKPSGNSFIRWNAEECSVFVELDDGQTIERIRNGLNEYELNGVVYKVPKTSVPDNIQNVLKLDEENFQKQIDPPFWICLTPGQLSKEINRIIDLEQIDEILDIASKDIRETKTKAKLAKEEMERHEQKRDSLEWTVDLVKKQKKIKKLQKELEVLKKDKNSLETLLEQLSTNKSKLKRLKSLQNRGEKARSALQTYLDLTKQKDSLQAILDDLKDDVHLDMEYEPEMRRLLNNLIKAEAERDELESIIDLATEKKNLLSGTRTSIRTITKQLEGVKCPTCNQPITANHLRHS